MWKPALLLLACPTIAVAAPCEQRDAEVWNVTASDAGLTACFQAGASCWTFDGKGWTPAAPNATPAPKDDDPPRGVHTIADKQSTATRAITKSEDNNSLTLIDTATQKPVGTIHRWRTPMWDNGFQTYGFVEDTLLVWMSDSPVSSQAKLFDGRGKLLARIGSGDVQESIGLDLGAHQWLFEQFEGNEAYVYNVASGKKIATLHLASKRTLAGGGRAGDAIVALAGGKVWAMQGAADAGAVVYDVATHTQHQVPLPLCAK